MVDRCLPAELVEGRHLRLEGLEVGAGLAATGEHQPGVHQHLPAVVRERPFTAPRDRRRQTITEADPVRERGHERQPHMRRDMVAPTLPPTTRPRW